MIYGHFLDRALSGVRLGCIERLNFHSTRRTTIVCAVCLLGVLSACSAMKVVTAPAEQDEKAKRFETVPGKAVVYVYRGDSVMGGDYTSTILLNGMAVGTGALNRYNVIVLNPGEYELGITSSFQSGYVMTVPIRVAAGKVYFAVEVWQMSVGFSLRPAAPEEAKAAIQAGRLVAWYEAPP